MNQRTGLDWKAPALSLAMTAASFAATTPVAPLGEHYVYDASGNMTEKTIHGKTSRMAYDKANRLLSKDDADGTSERFLYDPAGRPTTVLDAQGKVLRRMDYGYADKVISTTNGQEKTDFYYNAEGMLVGKAKAGQVSTYTWDGIALAAKDNEAYTNEAHITGGTPVLAGGNEVVVSDYLGSTLLQGACAFDSTAYGEGQESGRFTSKPFINELDSFIFPCRLYSSSNANWVTKDPLGFPDGANQYSFVLNDPVNHVDPMGTLTFTGFPVDPNPATKDDTDTASSKDVRITAYKAETVNSTTTARDLITAANPGLPANQRYVPSSVAAVTGTVTMDHWKAGIETAGVSGGGDIKATYSNMAALGADEAYQIVQDVDTNLPLAGTATSYLDGSIGGHPYLYGDQPGGQGYPNFGDFSSRPYSKLKLCGGTLDSITWAANTHLTIVDATAKTIKFPADSSFKWNWDIKEK